MKVAKLYSVKLDGKIFKETPFPVQLAFIVENDKVIGKIPILVDLKLRNGEESVRELVFVKSNVGPETKLELYFSDNLKYDLEFVKEYLLVDLTENLDFFEKEFLNQDLKEVGITKFLNQQEPLGTEFEKILYNNVWELSGT